MRAYRNAWQVLVAILTTGAWAAGVAGLGWVAMLVTVGAVALIGATTGYTWVEEPARRRSAIRALALWCGAGATLVLGLPLLIGPWAALVTASLGATSPRLLTLLADRRLPPRVVHPSGQVRQLSARDLERRWLRTSQRLRWHAGDPAVVLALVKEREILLDEIELLDPVAFDAILVSAGWRERQDR